MRSPWVRFNLGGRTSRQVALLVVQAVLVFLLLSLEPHSAPLAALLFILQVAFSVVRRCHTTTVLCVGTIAQVALLLLYLVRAPTTLAQSSGDAGTFPLQGVVLFEGDPQAGVRVHLPPGRTDITNELGEFGFSIERGEAVALIAVAVSNRSFWFPFSPPLTKPSFIDLPLEDPAHPRVRQLIVP